MKRLKLTIAIVALFVSSLLGAAAPATAASIDIQSQARHAPGIYLLPPPCQRGC